jgi:methionyl-tRNA formyltransferase
MGGINLILAGQKPVSEKLFTRLIEQSSAEIQVLNVVSNTHARGWWPASELEPMCRRKKIEFRDIEDPFNHFPTSPSGDTWLISSQYPHKISSKTIDSFKGQILNLHLAPLPEFKGWFGPSHAILQGREVYGWTLHQVDEDFDSGAIAAQRRFSLEGTETAKSLYLRTEQDAVDGVFSFLQMLAKNKVAKFEPQVQSGKFYSRSSLDEFKSLDLNSATPVEISRAARALFFPPNSFGKIRIGVEEFVMTPLENEQN